METKPILITVGEWKKFLAPLQDNQVVMIDLNTVDGTSYAYLQVVETDNHNIILIPRMHL